MFREDRYGGSGEVGMSGIEGFYRDYWEVQGGIQG